MAGPSVPPGPPYVIPNGEPITLPAAYRPGIASPSTLRTRPSGSTRGPPFVPSAPLWISYA